MFFIPSTDYKGLTLSRALNAVASERATYAEACFVLSGAAEAITQAGISKPTIAGGDEGGITLAWEKKSLTFMLWEDCCEDEVYVSWATHTGVYQECEEKEAPPQVPLTELLSDLRRFLRKGTPVAQKLLLDPLAFDVRDVTTKRQPVST